MTIENLHIHVHIDTCSYGLFVFGVYVPLENFYHYWWRISNFDLIYSLSSDGSSACNTYEYTGYLFKMVIFEDPDTHTWSRALGSGAVTTVFTTKVCRGWDSKTQPYACRTNALTDYATAAVVYKLCKNNYSSMA